MVCPYNLQGAQKKDFHELAKELGRKKRRPGSGSRNGPPKPRTRAPGQREPPDYEQPENLPADLNLLPREAKAPAD
jgi:hypothetical protein